MWSRQERYAAGAASDWTAITSTSRGRGVRNDARARGPAPSADGDDDRVGLRLLREDLERDRADAGDELGLVAGVDVAVAVENGELLAVRACVVEVPTVLDDVGAERADRGDLDRIRVLGDADRRLHPEETCGVGDRLAVVAGRGGDEPSPALRGIELRDEIDAAAHLERADGLVVLVLTQVSAPTSSDSIGYR